MKKPIVLFALACLMAALVPACKNASEADTAKTEAAEIQKLDSLNQELDAAQQEIESNREALKGALDSLVVEE